LSVIASTSGAALRLQEGLGGWQALAFWPFVGLVGGLNALQLKSRHLGQRVLPGRDCGSEDGHVVSGDGEGVVEYLEPQASDGLEMR
jgi:hypothetical protein